MDKIPSLEPKVRFTVDAFVKSIEDLLPVRNTTMMQRQVAWLGENGPRRARQEAVLRTGLDDDGPPQHRPGPLSCPHVYMHRVCCDCSASHRGTGWSGNAWGPELRRNMGNML